MKALREVLVRDIKPMTVQQFFIPKNMNRPFMHEGTRYDKCMGKEGKLYGVRHHEGKYIRREFKLKEIVTPL
jgi:hypothetical protein